MAAIGSAATFFIHKPNLKAFIVRLFVVRGFVGVADVVRVALAAVAAGLIDREAAGADEFRPHFHQVSAAGMTTICSTHCNKLRAAPNVPGNVGAIHAAIAAAFAIL
jgi:hypothetical protein